MALKTIAEAMTNDSEKKCIFEWKLNEQKVSFYLHLIVIVSVYF